MPIVRFRLIQTLSQHGRRAGFDPVADIGPMPPGPHKQTLRWDGETFGSC